jgi:Domain of unknown function (DUF1996)
MKLKLRTVDFLMILINLFHLLTPALGYWRHLCHGQLGQARIDPMMVPGKPSQHIHNIQGASSKSFSQYSRTADLIKHPDFGFNASLEDLMASACTSCSISQDKSVYWSPQMYFQHDNGTFELVATSGGLTA